jgi:purine-nucleoside phosphorylase
MGAGIRPETVRAAAHLIRARAGVAPRVAIIAGSGLGALDADLVPAVTLDLAEIPGWPVPTVEGHGRELRVGWLAGLPVAVQTGRVHLYEGFSPAEVTFNVRVFGLLGVRELIVTNAAGGLNPDFQVGDLMLIIDHISLPGLAGLSPLRGPAPPDWGPRFPAMGGAYSPRLRALARRAAAEVGLTLREGVYVMVGGPSYETPAEARLLRMLGGDAVGMSTAPEVVVARQMGLEVLGISCISNVWFRTDAEPAHGEVLAAVGAAAPRLRRLISRLIELLNER